jgi:hypothetical protein
VAIFSSVDAEPVTLAAVPLRVTVLLLAADQSRPSTDRPHWPDSILDPLWVPGFLQQLGSTEKTVWESNVEIPDKHGP